MHKICYLFGGIMSDYGCPTCGWNPDDEKYLISRSHSWAVPNAEGEDRYDWEETWMCPYCEKEFIIEDSNC
jgi:hypothetical protein